MAKPQSPELRRSGNIASFDPDNVAARVKASDRPRSSGPTGPVPEDNRPGHHPEREQSKPDLDDFVERFNRAGHDDDARHDDEDEQKAGPGRSGAGPSGAGSSDGVVSDGLNPLEMASRLRQALAPATSAMLETLAKYLRRSAKRVASLAERVDTQSATEVED